MKRWMINVSLPLVLLLLLGIAVVHSHARTPSGEDVTLQTPIGNQALARLKHPAEVFDDYGNCGCNEQDHES